MNAQQQPKTCGECRNFEPIDIVAGTCTYPIPADLPASLWRKTVYESDGYDCPCFEPKPTEADHAE